MYTWYIPIGSNRLLLERSALSFSGLVSTFYVTVVQVAWPVSRVPKEPRGFGASYLLHVEAARAGGVTQHVVKT